MKKYEKLHYFCELSEKILEIHQKIEHKIAIKKSLYKNKLTHS